IIMIIREKALIIIEYESAAEKILLPLASDLNILEITKKITKTIPALKSLPKKPVIIVIIK
ncbi:hypothetical protein, partial [Staphylococcus warneri]|uniref:hypothetical protein n=1 Tax=Staphylococcus warneri TaxID=1292 RepID=UPI003BF8A3BC